ncbi:hypothetical protein L6452_03325 [Arctium lappa]|uniref:Uncharacterized protein n=1 Tax=Arctium lappa TaxID=4217 RepID=A0ACB9FLC7_ARCLA|nr:hypothetical protein L6452_03325 [Arctium lappa]
MQLGVGGEYGLAVYHSDKEMEGLEREMPLHDKKFLMCRSINLVVFLNASVRSHMARFNPFAQIHLVRYDSIHFHSICANSSDVVNGLIEVEATSKDVPGGKNFKDMHGEPQEHEKLFRAIFRKKLVQKIGKRKRCRCKGEGAGGNGYSVRLGDLEKSRLPVALKERAEE